MSETTPQDWLPLRKQFPSVPEYYLKLLIGYRITEQGVIRSPGKFEGEMYYVPIFWSLALEGFSDSDDGEVFTFRIDAEMRKTYPGLPKRKRTLKLYEREDGFVCEA